jgi:hypothetical protein
MLELSSLVMKTPYYDISLVEEILISVKNNQRIDYNSIGSRRFLTRPTIEHIVERMIQEKILIKKSGVIKTTKVGDEMLSVLTVYLRPHNME